MTLTVCAVTSTRADWGLMAPVLALLRDDPAFDLQLIVTGQHLMPDAGDTAAMIAAEGFMASATIDMKLAGDTPEAVTSALATGIDGLGKAFARLRPDLVLILGDRYEILGAATAATLARIPIAHIAGGDLTEGAVDDAFRHAITKMSHLHFVTTDDAAQRVRQMGEDPTRVIVTGSPGLDRIRTTPLMDRTALFAAVGLPPLDRFLMVTFHPETLSADSRAACGEMLAALHQLGPEVGLVFSGSNADVEGRAVGGMIADFVRSHPNAVLHASLGSARYFSALKHADAVVGNSSSGLYEAPSFGTPSVNIGDRQKGRVRAASVIDVAARQADIYRGLQRAMEMDGTGIVNPYGDGHAAEKIVAALKAVGGLGTLQKRFADFPKA